MPSIAENLETIRNIDVENHTRIERKNWAELDYEGKQEIEDAIFGQDDKIDLSRQNVKSETDVRTKIVKTMMWGYRIPSGKPPREIHASILSNIASLEGIFFNVQNKNLNREEQASLFEQLAEIKGLASTMSTKSKLLYFFNVSFEDRKCLILDSKVVKCLTYFDEFNDVRWSTEQGNYSEYLTRMHEVSHNLGVSPEQLEKFLFDYADRI